MSVKRCTVILYSIHNVLKAEKVLKKANVHFDLIPVPRGLSSDCGMAVEFNHADIKMVHDTLVGVDLDIAGIYLNEDRNYKKLI